MVIYVLPFTALSVGNKMLEVCIREVIDKWDGCVHVFQVKGEKLYFTPEINPKYATVPKNSS